MQYKGEMLEEKVRDFVTEFRRKHFPNFTNEHDALVEVAYYDLIELDYVDFSNKKWLYQFTKNSMDKWLLAFRSAKPMDLSYLEEG